MSRFSHKYCFQLALKDLRHNKVSTILIILVIAAICLPLIIVSSLREGYIHILKTEIEESTQAKRIDIAAKSTIAEEQYITDEVIEKFKSDLPGVVEIVPQKGRTVYLLDKNGNQLDFEAITTIPADPDLKRFGFEGKFDSIHVNKPSIILRKSDMEDLGLLFHIGLEFQNDLRRNSNISEALRQEFEKYKIFLSQSATISTEKRDSSWIIIDKNNGKKYRVTKQRNEDKLSVCEKPNFLKVIVTRTVERRLESYYLHCKFLGTLKGGPSRKAYIPVPMGKKLERWTLGFGVKEYELPPAPDREKALGYPEANSCLAISPLTLTDAKRQLLSKIGMEVHEADFSSQQLHLYTVSPKTKGEKITESRSWTIEDALSGDISVKAIPNIQPIKLNIEEREVLLRPSVTADPRSEFLLKDGIWLNTQRNRFEIVLPASHEVNSQHRNSLKIPKSIETVVGQDAVRFTVVGTVKDKVGYVDYTLLYRLHQLVNNKATYDLKLNAFDVNKKSPYEDRFLFARVHVKDIDDIIPTVKYFGEEKGYEIYASSQVAVESLKNMNRLLRNLMILVGSTGGLAGIASLFVLMYEAIKRKRSEIGIMRAMGLSKGFITQIFLYQSVFYGLVGFSISFFLFKIVTLILDNDIGHSWLGIANLEGKVFISSIFLISGFVLSVIVISFIAGRNAARSARNIDPADILSDK